MWDLMAGSVTNRVRMRGEAMGWIHRVSRSESPPAFSCGVATTKTRSAQPTPFQPMRPQRWTQRSSRARRGIDLDGTDRHPAEGHLARGDAMGTAVDHLANDPVHTATRLRPGTNDHPRHHRPAPSDVPAYVVLPPVEWIVDDTVTVQFTPPSNFRQDPGPLFAIQDYDRANGLFVLERWLVPGDTSMATFSVQTTRARITAPEPTGVLRQHRNRRPHLVPVEQRDRRANRQATQHGHGRHRRLPVHGLGHPGIDAGTHRRTHQNMFSADLPAYVRFAQGAVGRAPASSA